MAASYKYEVPVRLTSKPAKVPEELKSRLVGVSPRLIARMKRETAECPVLGREVLFLQCYACPNFVRRVRSVVHCRGSPL